MIRKQPKMATLGKKILARRTCMLKRVQKYKVLGCDFNLYAKEAPILVTDQSMMMPNFVVFTESYLKTSLHFNSPVQKRQGTHTLEGFCMYNTMSR